MDAGRHRNGLNLPNAITIVRFPLAAAFPVVDGLAGRAAILAAAAASEWIDGRLARATGQVTRAGELLDPVADKTFMLVALATFGVEGRIPLWTLPLLLVRDIGVAIAVLAFAFRRRRVRMPARPAGKLVTWLQFTAIGALLLWPRAAPWIAPIVAAAGFFALQDYARSLSPAGRADASSADGHLS